MIVRETTYPAGTFATNYGERLLGLDRAGRAATWGRIHDDGSAEFMVVYQ